MGYRFSSIAFIALLLLTIVLRSATEAAPVKRPPQFVMLAFDGSQSIPMWQATRKFAVDATKAGAPVRFTYFVSAVYYVGAPYKSLYNAPMHGTGASAIGWGGNSADLLARFDQTNLANQEKHEIASHSVGHWDGSKWSYQQWSSEFEQFHRFFEDFFSINRISATALFPRGWSFIPKRINGFRAPLLGDNADLWRVLKDYRYRYDTSQTARTDYWPEMNSTGGHWNFPLAQIRIAGTGKKTLTMDYNFYVADSAAQPNPANKEIYKKQMVDTYLQYFQSNYSGNRAPIHIGHHFSLWNGAAYWEAMQEFALKVCGLPDVRCATYQELADFMDAQSPQTINAFREKNFDSPAPQPLFALGASPIDLDIRVRSNGRRIGFEFTGQTELVKTSQIRVKVNGQEWASAMDGIELTKLRERFRGGSASITVSLEREGIEIARSTHILRNIGLLEETFGDREEDQALLGDRPEAHFEDLK